MASINFVIPSISINGGVLCVMYHAEHLVRKGYDVKIYSMSQWDPGVHSLLPKPIQHMNIQVLSGSLPPADIQMATHYTTVPVVAQSQGRLRAQFIQHVESLFAIDLAEIGVVAPYIDATYRMPVYRICNSSWAQQVLTRLYGYVPDLALNAVDTTVYFPAVVDNSDEVRVVSFSDARKWKGTMDTFDALVMARAMDPELKIQWHAFGSYRVAEADWIHHHGVVSADKLNLLYATADVVLSLSWAESYPLPPIEAMAAGRVVLTTQFGTEDYLQNGVNGFSIPSRNALSAAEALVKILRLSSQVKESIRQNALTSARMNNWDRASVMFETALRRGLETPAMPQRLLENRVLNSLGIPTIGD